MKVVVLSQWLGENVSGISGGLGRALQRRGADVEYATGFETRRDWSVPPGTGGLRRRREHCDGMDLVRYPYFRSHDASSARRLATFGTFSATTSVLAPRQLRQADVVLVNATPATVAAAAMATRALHGTPYVLLVQDVWPDSIFASGFLDRPSIRRMGEPLVARGVRKSYRMASAVLGISPGMADLLVSRGAPRERTSHIFNWADESAVGEALGPAPRAPGEPLRLMYAGNFGAAQDLGSVIAAMALLPPGTASLTLVGGGAAESDLRVQVATAGLENITFHQQVSRQELASLMTTAHVHLLPLADRELFRITVPSKSQFLLAAGVPILCSAPGEAAGLVTSAGAGVACEPGSPVKLAEVIQNMARLPESDLVNMGQAARRFYEEEMSEKVNGDRLFKVLSEVSREA